VRLKRGVNGATAVEAYPWRKPAKRNEEINQKRVL
jgi:hypothetical protein